MHGGGEEREHQEQRRVHRVARGDDARAPDSSSDRREDVEDDAVSNSPSAFCPLSGTARRLPGRAAISLLVAVADREQHALVMMYSPRFSPWYSRMRVSTIESTGQLSSQKPQKMHLIRSMS